jgi:hypothetical protein
LISELLRKWFGLSNECASCIVLKDALERSEVERRELLHKLINPPVPTVVEEKEEEFQPITPQYTPWRVRQQILESEDRRAAQLRKDNAKEIEKLEREVGIASDEHGPSGGVKFKEK